MELVIWVTPYICRDRFKYDVTPNIETISIFISF
jgi:hypothetical protein